MPKPPCVAPKVTTNLAYFIRFCILISIRRFGLVGEPISAKLFL
jgi:hypothetical protein